jgi:predicted PurR-regulated permease PerM
MTSWRCDLVSWILAGIALVAVLKLGLLPALLAGLLVYELVHMIAARLGFTRMGGQRGKLMAVGLLSTLIVLALVASGFGIWWFVRSEAGSPTALLQKLAEIIDGARGTMPGWLLDMMPDNADDLRVALVTWLKTHAKEVQHAGVGVLIGLAHVLIGMVVGAMVALAEVRPMQESGELARSLRERADRLGDAFRRIVFAQVRISALNTVLTAIFLAGILPMFGVKLPLVKTIIVVTFLAGLLPVIGNLISNTIIVIVGLSVSLTVAVWCLVFLVVIHKLEYFVNARIVGSQIQARAWELLMAMLVMEAAFGLPGIVAAPIYYAYLKDELKARRLI